MAQKLNTVLYDEALGITEQDTSTIEQFSSKQNYFRGIAPFDNSSWIAYGIFHATNAQGNVGIPAEPLYMRFLGTDTVEGETFYVYEREFPKAVLGSSRATKIDVTISFVARTENLIGVSRYDENAVGYNDTTYIAAQLLIDYGSATVAGLFTGEIPVTDQYVRSYNTETDWVFDGAAWVDSDDVTVVDIEEHRSDTVASYSLRKGISTGRPTHAPNNTEPMIQAINDKINSTEAYANFYTKANADLRFVNVTGDTMQGDLNMGENNLTQIKEIEIKDTVNGGVAVLRYLHTNGNNYQVVQIVYPDGRVEEINEAFEYNYVNRTTAELNSGHVLMTDGMTQGNQAVNGLLFDEASANSMNLVGVVTVDGIADNGKSKATYMGLVHDIDESNFYVSGLAYAEGQIVWARGGKLSNVPPTKPSRVIRMGAIINQVSTKFDVVLAPLIYLNITELSDSTFTQVNGNVPISDGNKLINFDLTSALAGIESDKVDKTQTIAGIDLQNDILVSELLIAIGNATESVAGFLSEEDKRRLNLIYLAYGELPDGDSIVNTLTEIIEIMTQYQEGVDLIDLIGTKLKHDFSTYVSKSTPVANDLFMLGDSVNGFAPKKVTWQNILDAIFIASDTFSSSTDYKGEGLGSNKTAFITRHVMSLVTGGVVLTDIKDSVTGQAAYFTFPTFVSTDPIQISTDNGVGYKFLKLNGANVPANTKSEITILAYDNGTNWIYIAEDEVINDMLATDIKIGSIANYNTVHGTSFSTIEEIITDIESRHANSVNEQSYTGIAESTFGVLSPIKGAPQFNELRSVSAEQIVEGEGILDTATINFDSVTGITYYDSLHSAFIVGDNTNKVVTNDSGATADMMILPLTNKPYENDTLAQLNNRFPTYIPPGFNDTPFFELDTIGVQLIKKDNWEAGAISSGGIDISNNDIFRTPNITAIRVKSNTAYAYAIGVTTNLSSKSINYLDIDKNFISTTSFSTTFTTPSNCAYVRFEIAYTSGNRPDLEAFITHESILNEGTVASIFVPFNSPTDNFKLANGISVGNVQDRVYPDNDRWLLERKNDIDGTIVEGATGWSILAALPNTHVFYKSLGVALGYKKTGSNADVGNIESIIGTDIFSKASFNTINGSDVEGLVAIRTDDLVFYRVNKITYPTTTEFEAYIQTGTTFRSEQAESTTEEIHQDGSLRQESITTLIQKQVVGQDYDIEFVLDIASQQEMLINKTQTLQKEVDDIQEEKWTDLNTPLTLSVLGINTKPDYDATNLGLLFPQNDTSESISLIFQMPHSYKEGSDINPHVHIVQSLNLQAVFKVEYKWYNIGDEVPASWTTITLDTYPSNLPYVSGDMAQILEGSTHVDGTGMLISSILKIKLYRDDNVYTGDILADQFDIHFQQDSKGSTHEFIK